MHRLFFRPIFFAFAAYAVIDARRVKRCRQAQGALPLERMALHKRSPEVSCCRGFKSLLYFLHGRRKGPCRWSVCFPAVNLWASTHSQWPSPAMQPFFLVSANVSYSSSTISTAQIVADRCKSLQIAWVQKR